MEVVKLPSLASDSRYTTNNLRLKNVDSLAETIQARILEETTDYWIDLLVKHGFADLCSRIAPPLCADSVPDTFTVLPTDLL